MAHWLMKSEPSEFGIDDLEACGTEPWDGIRNYQARNMIRGRDEGRRPGVLLPFELRDPGHRRDHGDRDGGIPRSHRLRHRRQALRSRKSDPENPRWYPRRRAIRPPARRAPSRCSELKTFPELAGLPLVRRGNRLSVMPVSKGTNGSSSSPLNDGPNRVAGVASLVQCRVGATGRSPLRRPGCTRRPTCLVTPPANPTYGYRNGYIRHLTSDTTLAQEHAISRVPGLLAVPVSHLPQKAVERLVVGGRNLNAHQHPPVRGPVVPVVEEADVPASSEMGEKAQQGARPLRELEAEQALVRLGMPAPPPCGGRAASPSRRRSSRGPDSRGRRGGRSSRRGPRRRPAARVRGRSGPRPVRRHSGS